MFLPCLLATFLAAATLLPQNILAASSASQPAIRLVTASDYCDFLNDVASSDVTPAQAGTNISPSFFYNEKMGSDFSSACIARVSAGDNTPGGYKYFVIAGRENWPVTFVNENNQTAYTSCCGMMDSIDADFLASNQNDFFLPESLSSLSLAMPSLGPYAYSQWSEGAHIAFWSLLALGTGAMGEHIRAKLFDPVADGVQAISGTPDQVALELRRERDGINPNILVVQDPSALHEANQLFQEAADAKTVNSVLEAQIAELENQLRSEIDTGQTLKASFTRAKLARLRQQDAVEDARIADLHRQAEKLQAKALAVDQLHEQTQKMISDHHERLAADASRNQGERGIRMEIFHKQNNDRKMFNNPFADEQDSSTLYSSAAAFEKMIEENFIQGWRSCLEFEQYSTLEEYLRVAEKKYEEEDFANAGTLQAIDRKFKINISALKKALATVRVSKQKDYVFGEKAVSYFLSDETVSEIFAKQSKHLETAGKRLLQAVTGSAMEKSKAVAADHDIASRNSFASTGEVEHSRHTGAGLLNIFHRTSSAVSDTGHDGKYDVKEKGSDDSAFVEAPEELPAAFHWEMMVAQAKEIIERDKKAHEEKKTAAAKYLNERQEKLTKAEKELFGGVNDKKEKRDIAQSAATKADNALNIFNQVEQQVREKHGHLSATFDQASLELSKSWELLHTTEQQFVSADWLQRFMQADTGRVDINAETVLEKLGGLLKIVRAKADETLTHFEKVMATIDADFKAQSMEQSKVADSKVSAEETATATSLAAIDNALSTIKAIEGLLKKAQEQADLLLENRQDDFEAARDSLQEIIAQLLEMLKEVPASITDPYAGAAS